MKARTRRGSALVIVLAFVLIFSIGVAAVMSASYYHTRETHRVRVNGDSLAGARATLDAFSNNILHLATTRPPAQLGGDIATLNDVIHDVTPVPPPGIELVEQDGKRLTYVLDRGVNDFEFREITDPNHQWYGYTIAELDYELVATARDASSRAQLLGYEGSAVHQRVTVSYIPFYQFAIFYDPTLELHPGPVMDVYGRVHSNTNLYLSAGNGNTLSFYGKITCAGNVYRFKGEDNHDGTVRIKNGPGSNDWGLMTSPPSPNDGDAYFDHRDSQVWFQGALDRWKGNLLDSAHGIQPIMPPLPTGAEMLDLIRRLKDDDPPEMRAVKFEAMADIIITGDPKSENGIKAYLQSWDGDARTLTEISQTEVKKFTDVGAFYDGHCQTVVRTIDVDMGKLNDYFNATDFFDQPGRQGILYVSTTPGTTDSYTLGNNNKDPDWERDANGNIVVIQTGSGTGNPKIKSGGNAGWTQTGKDNYMPAVRVVNASKVPRNAQKGFGFYTDRPLYTVGDINTSGEKATIVFGGDALTVTAYKQRLAVTNGGGNSLVDTDESGDRIAQGFTRDMGNNYSNSTYSWDVGNNNTDLYQNGSTATMKISDKVKAKETTTNCIFLMGNTPSVFADDNDVKPINAQLNSGGAHNVMRYLESWSGIKHNFNGSMIILYGSGVAVHKYRSPGGTKGYYNAPNRKYSWDSSLQKSQPPPGMPTFIEIRKFEMERSTVDYALANAPD